MTATEEWARALRDWAIPDEILSAAPEPPWWFPVGVFVDYAREAESGDWTPTHRHAAVALPAGGVLLDVGSGAGAASLPLAPPAGRIVAVDENHEMLQAAAELLAGRVPIEIVEGRWPEAADRVGIADVTVCANVLYNVADAVGRFIEALDRSARRRVVVELTAVHPMAELSRFWRHFWNLDRPTRPNAEDAIELIREVTGRDVSSERWCRHRSYLADGDSRHQTVPHIRRRLCLTPSADEEIARLLAEMPDADSAAVVTICWDTGSL